ncbi:MAG: hypothetical protein HKM04_12020 [Legionellales bacterium]|nr:hypothetical protein [Legionellales bacterium]
MPALIREDGEQFAVYTYREILSGKSLSVLRREALIISRENGRFARFFSVGNNEVEGVFSGDSGYLIGELIWRHFGTPDDLLYCEALSDGENALLIVVRGGSIYLDAQIPIANVVDEFISLSAGENQYQIYVYGDVPIAEFPSDEKFAFEASQVESFIELDTPVFPTLEVDETFKLQPIDMALASYKTSSPVATKAIITVIFLAILLYVGWKVLAPPPPPPVVIKKTAPVLTQQQVKANQQKYATYQSSLMSPAPSDILMAASNDIELLLTIPGWTPISMTYTPQGLAFGLKTNGGDLGILLAWIKTNHVELQAASGKATLFFPLNLENRAKPRIIYNLRDTVASLYDILKRVIPNTGPSLGVTTSQNNYRQSLLTVNFTGLAPESMVLLAKELQPYPIILQKLTLTIDSGILSGTMQFQILGV